MEFWSWPCKSHEHSTATRAFLRRKEREKNVNIVSNLGQHAKEILFQRKDLRSNPEISHPTDESVLKNTKDERILQIFEDAKKRKIFFHEIPFHGLGLLQSVGVSVLTVDIHRILP